MLYTALRVICLMRCILRSRLCNSQAKNEGVDRACRATYCYTMMNATRYQQSRFVIRFTTYRAGVAPTLPLPVVVQSWLKTLPVSQQSMARLAIKRHLGPQNMDWSAVTTDKYHRDEANLLASVLRDEDRAKVRAATQDARELAVVECLWTLRRFEVAALRWADIDLRQGMARIRLGKGGKPSWTLLTGDAQAALAAWFTAAGEPPDETPVFPIPPGVGHPKHVGQPYTANGLGKWVQRILERGGVWKAGIGSCHRFRRSFATQYLRANPQDLIGLQRLMRHSTVATTSKYCFLEPDDLTPRMAKMRL